MEAATPKIVLERLKEEWVAVPDATIYRELEIEKQMWMLTALKLVSRGFKKGGGSGRAAAGEEIFRRIKILSLFENQGISPLLLCLSFTKSKSIY